MDKLRDSLTEGTEIDCYVIMKVVASGGFSLIYLAEDEDTQDEVIIKEFLPKKLAKRGGNGKVIPLDDKQADNFNRSLRLFYQEAKVLASLRHPNIVQVRGFFLANNTGYLVMDHERGKNLASYIKKRSGSLSTRFLMTVFPPILDALNLIHSRNLLHLDIKPSNIHLRTGGNPLLLDFGAVHEVQNEGSRTGRVVTTGFSPVEQYYQSGNVGPWSDVYAIGASMRACLDGKAPPSAIERHAKEKLKPAARIYRRRYPASMLEAIDWAMEIEYEKRPQDAGELLQALQVDKLDSESAISNLIGEERAIS
ncbi:MAG: serine/threonine-protein kinase [Candidatus Thiodiazotropha endolucinida]|uniref:non-specific serine/threonine protein kinase n=1 Tax=Candidatus Thiodiazotropha endolucinida TaxID=1655433 RepID=A0A7Z0VQ12_9GAMM|nr:serine/threonine-protein kinase [Candidatus Thiodiazotropha endolucinida]MBT3016563.1 serine/threonine protein kinase [Candidatus Thiodiazotropha taylori]MBT3032436.1 serine/threonine protein kinase [Candidatus Thiodiazotropha sp. (ex Lucina pensylvanica)]MBT3053054.1 serine/threonine protein kinase [Candidatus Thiodiazotropha sp. (ex Codakia orbicularis)]MCG7864495.1 serine/threonine protein kinase [Candidatus Thiodiazotropha endolucinida]ODJ89074.1 serine/threonine-protein kinase D [Candi